MIRLNCLINYSIIIGTITLLFYLTFFILHLIRLLLWSLKRTLLSTSNIPLSFLTSIIQHREWKLSWYNSLPFALCGSASEFSYFCCTALFWEPFFVLIWKKVMETHACTIEWFWDMPCASYSWTHRANYFLIELFTEHILLLEICTNNKYYTFWFRVWSYLV